MWNTTKEIEMCQLDSCGLFHTLYILLATNPWHYPVLTDQGNWKNIRPPTF